MIDETKERLIVMGGATEPGEFQIEITESSEPKLVGSIILATEQRNNSYPCDKCRSIFHVIRKSVAALERAMGQRNPGGRDGVYLCHCQSRRID